KDVIGKMGRHEYALLSKTDAYVFIPGPVLGGSPRLTRGEVIASTAYNSTWYKAAKAAGLRGARLTFGYVGEELARILVKSVGEIVDHQLVASMVDSQKVRANGKKLARLMKTRGEVVVRAEGDALRFRLGGEQEIDDGMIDRADLTVGNNMTNVPPGYLARETVPGSLSGAIKIHAPVPRLGAMGDVRLEFAGGKLKSWESEKNQEWLNGLVTGTPDQRRTLSAVVIGLNPSMKYRYGQDRLVEGAVTLFGMFQGTTRNGSLEVDGRLLIDKGRMLA
ncbi:MAG TPA: hypothetical protein VEC08_03150, partial [Nitrososphaerales archaeon]|nr:hypothetical protein [Nitrososphaerales archaeon]